MLHDLGRRWSCSPRLALEGGEIGRHVAGRGDAVASIGAVVRGRFAAEDVAGDHFPLREIDTQYSPQSEEQISASSRVRSGSCGGLLDGHGASLRFRGFRANSRRRTKRRPILRPRGAWRIAGRRWLSAKARLTSGSVNHRGSVLSSSSSPSMNLPRFDNAFLLPSFPARQTEFDVKIK